MWREGRAAEQWQRCSLLQVAWHGCGTWDITIPLGFHLPPRAPGLEKAAKTLGRVLPAWILQFLCTAADDERGSYNHHRHMLPSWDPLQSPGSWGLMAEGTLGWVGEGLWVCFRSCPDCQKLCAVRKKTKKTPRLKNDTGTFVLELYRLCSQTLCK